MIARLGCSLTVIVTLIEALSPSESVTVTVKPYSPVSVGVPEITPLAESERPPGNCAPEENDSGPTPPEALSEVE